MSLKPAYNDHFDRFIIPVALDDLDIDQESALDRLLHDANLDHIAETANEYDDPVMLLWMYRQPGSIYSAGICERENALETMNRLQKDIGLLTTFQPNRKHRQPEMLENFKAFLRESDETYYTWEMLVIGGEKEYSEEEAINIVKTLADEYGYEVPNIDFTVDPNVLATTGEQAGGYYEKSTNTLHLGEMLQTSVLHEIAHWIDHQENIKDNVILAAPHGARFAQIAIDLYDRFTKLDKAAMTKLSKGLGIIPDETKPQEFFAPADLDTLLEPYMQDNQPEAINALD